MGHAETTNSIPDDDASNTVSNCSSNFGADEVPSETATATAPPTLEPEFWSQRSTPKKIDNVHFDNSRHEPTNGTTCNSQVSDEMDIDLLISIFRLNYVCDEASAIIAALDPASVADLFG